MHFTFLTANVQLIQSVLLKYVGIMDMGIDNDSQSSHSDFDAIIALQKDNLALKYEVVMMKWQGCNGNFPSLEALTKKEVEQPWTDIACRIMETCLECALTGQANTICTKGNLKKIACIVYVYS